MTKERAQELLALASAKIAGPVPWAPGQAPTHKRGGYIYSDSHELHEHPRGMTRGEEREVKERWRTMPGWTCFMDALARLTEEPSCR